MANKLRARVADVPWTFIGTKNAILYTNTSELHEGDEISVINGQKKVVAHITTLEKTGKNRIEIDKTLRDQISANLGDTVEIEKIFDIPDAVSVEIGVDDESEKQSNFAELLNNRIICRGTTEVFFEDNITIRILDAQPSDIVKIVPNTTIRFNDEPDINRQKMVIVKNATISKNEPMFSEIPAIGFDAVGGLENIKTILQENIIQSIKNPAAFIKMGYKPMKGILLYGPPGTGKTLLAMATAHEADANFMYFSGSEFKDMYYGESEKKLRLTFEKGLKNTPCIIFIDEIDAITQTRDGKQISIVNQLLTLMDKIAQEDVYIIAATNLIDIIDPAIIRPGRFFKVEVPRPNKIEREQIYRIFLKGISVSDEQFASLAKRSENFSGADIMHICNIAKLMALRENGYSTEARLTIEHVMRGIEAFENKQEKALFGKKAEDGYDVGRFS